MFQGFPWMMVEIQILHVPASDNSGRLSDWAGPV
jgi:hypothetical protein